MSDVVFGRNDCPRYFVGLSYAGEDINNNCLHLVEEAFKVGRAYDQVYVKLDGDRDPAEMAAADALALELGVTILRSNPATEQLLMSILEPEKRISSWDTDRLKRYFEDNYIARTRRTDQRVYEALFTREVLEEARGRVGELEGVLGLF